jgi:predicted transcriptional regulator
MSTDGIIEFIAELIAVGLIVETKPDYYRITHKGMAATNAALDKLTKLDRCLVMIRALLVLRGEE